MLRDILFYLKRLSKFCRETVHFLIVVLRDNRTKAGRDAIIRVGYNGYSTGPKREWFLDYLRALTGQKAVASWYRPTLIFTSSFGSYHLLRILLSFYRVPSLFFSEENLATLKKYREYRSYLDGQPTLAMGFDYREEENYHRFPLWLLYLFEPEFVARASVEDIRQRLVRIEEQGQQEKEKFAAMVASHDGYASKKKVYGCLETTSRAFITEQIGAVDFVHCPGKLLYNDDSLRREFDDNKKAYIKQFLFNICAENAAVTGYVTEKLLEAVEGGTIPIYWGAKNPESEILNQQRILFWDESMRDEVVARVRSIYTDSKVREEFLQQPVFTPGAPEAIYNYFSQLKKDFRELLLRD